MSNVVITDFYLQGNLGSKSKAQSQELFSRPVDSLTRIIDASYRTAVWIDRTYTSSRLVFITVLLWGSFQFSRSVLSRVFATPWTKGRQPSLFITNFQSLLKLMCIQSVMPSNHLILCCLLLPPASVFPNITVFSSESVILIR